MTNLGLRLAASTSSRRASAFATTKNTRWLRRNVHLRRELPYPVEQGLGDFLPPAALKTVAVDFQQGLLDRLREEVRDSEQENQDIAQIIIQTASDRSRTLAFNYASQALNNSYFLDCLKPPPLPSKRNHEEGISSYLGGTIRTQHGTLQDFMSTFSATALGMISSGWVWFVTDKNGQTGVLPTFGAGTLLVRSRMHVGPPDSLPVLGSKIGAGEGKAGSEKAAIGIETEGGRATEDALGVPSANPDPSSHSDAPQPTSPTSGVSHGAPPIHPSTPTRALHTSPVHPNMSSLISSPPGLYSNGPLGTSRPTPKINPETLGAQLYPLFCLSVHEHAWMSAGRGVWGKEAYLRDFWTVLDWEKVSRRFESWVADRTKV